MSGFWNKLLHVNLSTLELWEDSLPVDVWRNYIGGIGLGAYLFTKYGGDYPPFSEQNPIIITTGPLVGSAFPNTGRHEIVSRSPQTTFLGESNSGGRFGFELKRAGVDAIVIHGGADTPIMLYITKKRSWLEPAQHLWGLDIYQTQQIIKKSINFSVATIGPAGENQVFFAAVMNDEGRAAGRTGLGAVFGAKKLKAIAVKGSLKVPVFDRSAFNKHARNIAKQLYSAPFNMGLRNYGSMLWIDGGQGLGDVPAHYFTDHEFEYDALSGMKFNETFNVQSYHCATCVIGCGRSVKLNNHTVDGPEYETVAALGSLLGNTDFNKIVLWNDRINAMGMDTISTGVLISALYYFIQSHHIHNNALARYFDDHFAGVQQLIEDIAMKQGAGAVLAQGLNSFALNEGIDKDLIATVKRLEVPMHDVRAFKLQGLAYATSSRGADHLQAEMYAVDIGATQEDIGITMGDRWQVDTDERVLSLIKTQDYRQIQNSAIICVYAQIRAKDLLTALNLATGFNITSEEMMHIGADIINLKRKINETLGLKPEDDWLPKIVRKRVDVNAEETELSDAELRSLLQRYYKLRNWDKSSI